MEKGFRPLGTEEKEKYRVAESLGLLPQLREKGWAGLTPQQSGRVGGVLSAQKRAQRKK